MLGPAPEHLLLSKRYNNNVQHTLFNIIIIITLGFDTLILGHGPMRRFGLGLRVTMRCSQIGAQQQHLVRERLVKGLRCLRMVCERFAMSEIELWPRCVCERFVNTIRERFAVFANGGYYYYYYYYTITAITTTTIIIIIMIIIIIIIVIVDITSRPLPVFVNSV